MLDLLRRSSPLWRHANFNRLWAAQILSAFGSRITRTAIPIIAVGVLLVSPGEAALLSALTYAPYVLTGLFAGGFVERSSKVRLMIAMDLVRCAIVLAAPVAWMFNLLSFPLLCVLAMLAGAASAIFANADIAILPRLLGKNDLVEANSRLQATESIAELAGPGAAGLLIDLLTAPIAMLVDALTFLWSAVWLWRIPREATETAAEPKPAVRHQPLKTLRDDIVVGFGAIVRRPALRAITLAGLPFWTSAGFFFATFTLFMMRDLDLPPIAMGFIISAGGLSALAGSILALPLSRRIGFGPAMVAGFALATLGTLMLIPAALIGGWEATPFMIAQQLLGDSGMMIFFVLSTSLQQSLLPEDEIARANGFNQAVAGGVMTASILAAGVVAETIGVSPTVMIGSSIALLGVFPLLTPELVGMRKPPSQNLEAAAAD